MAKKKKQKQNIPYANFHVKEWGQEKVWTFTSQYLPKRNSKRTYEKIKA